MPLLESIASQGFAGLLSNLASSYLTNRSNRISLDEEQIKTDISENIKAAFEKCSSIKTILSDEIVPFLEIYSDQNFSISGIDIDQYDLVEEIRSGKSVIISGTGGGGKSMFMRYLWLSYFEDPRGKIPFFLELRQLNRLTHDSIEDFLFHSIILSGSKISQKNFLKSLHSGHFIVFLDGFDEVNFDKRQYIEQLIIKMKSNHPATTVVVTSRPDERFRGWHQFHLVKVEPLTKEKCVALLRKARFDKGKIDKIIKKIEEGLYETHTSFLSNPLLAYMLLVTFAYNPDIPKKMFLFYEQAFEALYHRHDLTKGGYSRRFFLSRDKQFFINQLSYFCLLSYYDEAFEFRDETLRNYVSKARAIENSDYDVELFIRDILESVCLIKLEGLDYSFTHRSFQEYFAAYCIARVASRDVERIFSKFSNRYNDQVLGLVYDINKDLFREKYVIPFYNKYLSFYDIDNEDLLVVEFMRIKEATFVIDINRSLQVNRKQKRKLPNSWIIDLFCVGEFESFDRNVQRLSEDYYHLEQEPLDITRGKDDVFVDRLHKDIGTDVKAVSIIAAERGYEFQLDGNATNLKPDDYKWKDSYMYQFVRTRALRHKAFVTKERAEFVNVTNSLNAFLS